MFRDDMISDGIENCVQYIHNFDPEKSRNPFAYFTQIIHYAFLRRIQKEKKQLDIKNFIFSFLLASVMWVQVPQWEADWSKCAVDVPDSSCHWYVAAPDNTFGEGFNWENAPWFDANGLQDVAKIEKESVVEKLQNN